MVRDETSSVTPGVTHLVPTAVGTEWVTPGDEMAILVAILDIGISLMPDIKFLFLSLYTA